MDEFDDLNLSWANEFKTVFNHSIIAPEIVEQISISFVYVNTSLEIDCILEENIKLDIVNDKHSILSENILLQLIHKYKVRDHGPRYKAEHILQYLVSLDDIKSLMDYVDPSRHSDVQDKGFFKASYIPNNIVVPATFCMFHSLNKIWIFFYELTLVEPKPIIHTAPLVSILKKENLGNITKKKRVRISSDVTEKIFASNKSKKLRD